MKTPEEIDWALVFLILVSAVWIALAHARIDALEAHHEPAAVAAGR